MTDISCGFKCEITYQGKVTKIMEKFQIEYDKK